MKPAAADSAVAGFVSTPAVSFLHLPKHLELRHYNQLSSRHFRVARRRPRACEPPLHSSSKEADAMPDNHNEDDDGAQPHVDDGPAGAA